MKTYLLRLKKPILLAIVFAFVVAIVTIARAPQADTRRLQKATKLNKQANAA